MRLRRSGGRQRRPSRPPRSGGLPAWLLLLVALTVGVWLLWSRAGALRLGPLTVPGLERAIGALALLVVGAAVFAVLARGLRRPRSSSQEAVFERPRPVETSPALPLAAAAGAAVELAPLVLSGLRTTPVEPAGGEPLPVEHAPEDEEVGGGASGAPLLRLALLGPVQLEDRDGASPRLRGSSRELLVFLALQPHGASREAILAALWPESDPRQSRQWLWRDTSETRRALGPVVRRRQEHYRLDPTLASSDLDELERLLTGAALAGEEEPTGLLEQAYGLFRGEPLADCGYAWADGQRRRLRAVLVELTTRLAEAQLSAGNPTAALALAERGLELDELDEQLWRLALRAEAQLGLRAAVEQRYSTLRALLDQRLGLDPERETRELHRQLLSQS